MQAKLNLIQSGLGQKAKMKYTTSIQIESCIINKLRIQAMAKIAKAFSVSIEGSTK